MQDTTWTEEDEYGPTQSLDDVTLYLRQVGGIKLFLVANLIGKQYFWAYYNYVAQVLRVQRCSATDTPWTEADDVLCWESTCFREVTNYRGATPCAEIPNPKCSKKTSLHQLRTIVLHAEALPYRLSYATTVGPVSWLCWLKKGSDNEVYYYFPQGKQWLLMPCSDASITGVRVAVAELPPRMRNIGAKVCTETEVPKDEKETDTDGMPILVTKTKALPYFTATLEYENTCLCVDAQGSMEAIKATIRLLTEITLGQK